jgi:pyridoxine 5-phosphate synthase
MTRLSVNVNKVATLRNARGKDLPNVLSESLKIIEFGAQGITVHPRPDGRHIRWPDVVELKENISVELNVEGFPESHFLEKVGQIKPDQCTLVPDPPEVLTSNAGWRLEGNEELLKKAVTALKNKNIRVSLFVDPNEIQMKELLAFRDLGVDRVELYTESYAEAFKVGQQEEEIKAYQKCAKLADSMGMKVNAGHDLNLHNLKFFNDHIEELAEVSIGHALVCDALNEGWKNTVNQYRNCLK